jgi:hypothetical protein
MIDRASGTSAQYRMPVVLCLGCIEQIDEIISPHFAKEGYERGRGDTFVKTA